MRRERLLRCPIILWKSRWFFSTSRPPKEKRNDAIQCCLLALAHLTMCQWPIRFGCCCRICGRHVMPRHEMACAHSTRKRPLCRSAYRMHNKMTQRTPTSSHSPLYVVEQHVTDGAEHDPTVFRAGHGPVFLAASGARQSHARRPRRPLRGPCAACTAVATVV